MKGSLFVWIIFFHPQTWARKLSVVIEQILILFSSNFVKTSEKQQQQQKK